MGAYIAKIMWFRLGEGLPLRFISSFHIASLSSASRFYSQISHVFVTLIVKGHKRIDDISTGKMAELKHK